MSPEEAQQVSGVFTQIFAAHDPFSNLENKNVHKDGRIIILETSGVPIVDADGIFCGYRGIDRDITARKQAEIELLQSKEALEIAHHELEKSFAREQQLAHIDDLTGINNRRSLFELAEREFNVALRYHLPLSVLMFDIDQFKQINDTFGHAMGDQVLERVTQVVCAKLRSTDIIGRYGGDEFVILLPQTNLQEVLPLADRIHASIDAIRMETDKGLLTVNISIGVAQMDYNTPQSDTVENLFLRADKALYAAKKDGRSRTGIFDAK
jgi:diguanylate cyclase (GGDEF)-like protein